jgi:large subunit ribosomal protein L27e
VVIIQPVDNGNKPHPFGHALVAGIERYPSRITRRMSKARQDKRSKIKPFIKVVNYNHLMPTRYTLELEGLKGSVSNDTFKEVSQREDAKKNVKKILEERYTSGKNRWFFTPLSTFGPFNGTFALPKSLLSPIYSVPAVAVRELCFEGLHAVANLASNRILKSFSPSRSGSWRDVQSIKWQLRNPGLWAQYEVH